MAGTPIKLGSAAGASLIFEKGSRITTTASGIQSCAVSALCPDGANVFAFLPPAGSTFNFVFGNNYLPATFRVDITGGGYDIEYLEGKAARVTINFKRPDPNRPTGRSGAKISVDSAINYKSILDQWGLPAIVAADGTTPAVYGFPEPITTVKYASITPPAIGGGLNPLYAQPGTPRTAGFPNLAEIDIALDFTVPNGTVVTYFDGTTFQSFTATGPQVCHFQQVFFPNPMGWKLEKLKWDPQSDSSFYDVEETWRGQYFFNGVRFSGHSPP
jgi:hypothetical protein